MLRAEVAGADAAPAAVVGVAAEATGTPRAVQGLVPAMPGRAVGRRDPTVLEAAAAAAVRAAIPPARASRRGRPA